jgi:hypothetical protein
MAIAPQPLHAGRKTLIVLAVALACAVLACLLPERPYHRWQLLDGTIHARSRWIYERIHYDPNPIDVAFVGPSRIGAGISAPRLAQRLAERGLPANVVNFSLPETGRNINAAIVDELLSGKSPKLIVIGVIEKPSRYGHSAFKYVAPREMILSPGYLGNLNYLSDLIYLPYRQLKLFAAYLFPGLAGFDDRFAPDRYPGSIYETTGDIRLPDGTIKNGTVPADMVELQRGVTKLRRTSQAPLLGASGADIEFGDERHHIRRIVGAARAKNVAVAFLSLPYYTGPTSLQEERFYRQFGPIWDANFTRNRADLFSDYGHLTASGAAIVTDQVAKLVAAELEKR